jgi:uncharacterized protein DUF2865
MRWHPSALLLGSLLLVAAPLAGAKASPTCDRLSAQLASVPSGAGSTTNYRRYATAARKQSGQIKQVRGDLKRYGCSSGSFIVMGGANGAACKKLSDAEAKMQANLRALERKRDTYAAETSGKAQRQRVLAALRANGCLDQPETKRKVVPIPAGTQASTRVTTELSPTRRNGMTIVDRSGGSDGVPLGSSGNARIVVEHKSAQGGNLRTLCVRACDGYFFPISSAATSADFGRDRRTCQMMCPGTQTDLFYHSVYGQESEDMVSVTSGLPYSEMPNAFRYLSGDARGSGCGCNMSAFYKEMQRREAIFNNAGATGESDDNDAILTVRPSARPDPGEDPETIVNGQAALTADAIAAVASASRTERPVGDQLHKMRVVGPVYLPATAEKLDFTANTDKIGDIFR